jgi:hypothetical protein
MKTIYKPSEKTVIDSLDEAFKTGMSPKVFNVMMKTLIKRTGIKFKYQTDNLVPFFHKHPRLGNLAGYFAWFPNGKSLLRMNFSIGKRDEIVSFDVYETARRFIPDYTIELQGYNIMQVIDSVVDAITGDFFKYGSLDESTVIHEASIESVVLAFLNTDPTAVRDFKSGNFNFDAIYQRYATFSQNVHNKTPQIPTEFRYHANIQSKQANMGFKIPVAAVRSGIQTIAIAPASDNQAFDDQVVNNGHVIKFQMLEYTMKRIRDNDPYVKNVYLYGVGGIGKTKTVTTILGDLPNFVHYKSGIRGYEGLLQMLYDNRKDKIICLDDCIKQEQLKDGAFENILKTVMDSDEPRIVKFLKKRPAGAQESQVSENFTVDLVNFNSDEGVDGSEDMNSFVFKSRIIFVTNLSTVPEAVGDRCFTIEMNFDTTQVLDIIKTSLEKFDPTCPIEDKLIVWQFLKDNLRYAKKISFRVFHNVLGLYRSQASIPGNNSWESFAIEFLKSGFAAK